MNRKKQQITAITLQKLKKFFWSVFSFGLITALIFGSFSGFDLLPDATEEQSQNSPNKSFDFLPSSTTNQIIQHNYYTLSYNEKHEQAEWVAYELKKITSKVTTSKGLISLKIQR